MEKKFNLKERAKMVRAMEEVIRNLNDESFIDSWLMGGVADGDINNDTTDEDLEWYCEDRNFADIMALFSRIMYRATKEDYSNKGDGTFYCDRVVGKHIEWSR